MSKPESVTTKIKATQAICPEYGKCWSCDGPYYTGHHRTKKAALISAKKNIKGLKKALGIK